MTQAHFLTYSLHPQYKGQLLEQEQTQAAYNLSPSTGEESRTPISIYKIEFNPGFTQFSPWGFAQPKLNPGLAPGVD